MTRLGRSLDIANELREIASLERILKAVKSTGSSTFTEILSQSGVSSRTLAKHLNKLVVSGTVEKRDAQYRITSEGSEYAQALRLQQEKANKYRRIAAPNARRLVRDYAVEVTTVTPFGSGHSLGIFHVARARTLELNERQQMDQALTKAMQLIAGAIPTGCKEFGVRITGTLR